MALRSVEFNTALDELLTLIHNISLFQVSPEAVEWKGVDSVRLNTLSESCEAETLQLYYQIGLMSKKDLPLAPDPRTGFEMAILRMIAFQPAREDGPPSDRSGNIQDSGRGPGNSPHRDPARNGVYGGRPDRG